MSTVYVLEPPTRGKVILKTNYGPLDIELWPKEAPKAVRNFVQLCLEGYYDNTIFHRIIKSFLIQGGDPTGTGEGGESIYGGVFPDEFHSRLRFKHRGLVACAGAGKPNTNGSQFFISLDQCDWLNKKHTIFGKVTGDSIYNLIRIGEIETDKNDRPVDAPPKVLSVEVLWNPFDDISPRVSTNSLDSSKLEPEKTDAKPKSIKKLNLLSFGEEAEEEEKELAIVKTKIKSSHDVLNDPRLLKDEKDTNDKDSSEAKLVRDKLVRERETLISRREDPQQSGTELQESPVDSDEGEANFDAKMRRQILQKRKELGVVPSKQKPHKVSDSAGPGNRSSSPPRSLEESDEDRPKVEKLSLKKKGLGSEARAELIAKADQDLQLLSNAERERQLQKQKKRRRGGQEDEVLKKLDKFKAAFSSKSNGLKAEKAGSNDVLADWMKNSLKFAPEPGKDNMSRSNDPNDYVVHDPLLEKGKEKFNKMQAKQKRREREWAGKSLT